MHGLCVVIMCRNPDFNFKRRIRFSKKNKMLYMDIMLDLEQMKNYQYQERREIIIKHLIEEVPFVVYKYKFSDFDAIAFEKDFIKWLKEV